MEVPVPRKTADTLKIESDSAHTILIDGNNEGKFYVYRGKSNPPATTLVIEEYTRDGLRGYIRAQSAQTAGGKEAVFIVKWGGNAAYNEIINVIDELKIAGFSKYALTKISNPELQKLSLKTGKKYPELSEPNS